MLKNMIANLIIKRMESSFQKARQLIVDTVADRAARHDGLKVLDVGCGNGMLIERIQAATNNCAIYGMDAVHSCQHLDDVRFTQCNLENYRFPYEDDSFDVIYSNQVIEHLIFKDFFASEIFRTLKPGGTAVIATDNIASLENAISLLLGQEPFSYASSIIYSLNTFLSPHFRYEHDYDSVVVDGYYLGHKNVCSYYGLKRLLAYSGFSDITMHGFGHALPLMDRLLPFQCRIMAAVIHK